MISNRAISVDEICKTLEIEYKGCNNSFQSLGLCNRVSLFDRILTYSTSPKFCEAIVNNHVVVAAVINGKCFEELVRIDDRICDRLSLIVVENPEFVFYDIHELLYKQGFYNSEGKEPVLGKNCSIHPSVFIDHNVTIGNNVIIGPNTVINGGTIIEDDVEIGCNSVIGGHGFQALKHYPKIIHHVGGVILHKGAYIGNLTTVSKSLFEGYTEVGEYSKIDDHVHFSHNCKCGRLCTITAGTVLMGSVVIGDNVWISPSSLILNKKHIGDDSFIGSMSYVNSEVMPKSFMMGIPAKCFNK